MKLTAKERDEFNAWAEKQRAFVVPQIRESRMTMVLQKGEPGIDMLLQIGASIYYNKPLLLVVCAGEKPNPKLYEFATEVVELDGPLDETARTKIEAAMKRVLDVPREAQ